MMMSKMYKMIWNKYYRNFWLVHKFINSSNNESYWHILTFLGNEDNAFYLTRESDYKIKISNQKKLVGPKEYKLQLLTSIFKDGALNTQFMTTYYIYVSAYGFF